MMAYQTTLSFESAFDSGSSRYENRNTSRHRPEEVLDKYTFICFASPEVHAKYLRLEDSYVREIGDVFFELKWLYFERKIESSKYRASLDIKNIHLEADIDFERSIYRISSINIL